MHCREPQTLVDLPRFPPPQAGSGRTGSVWVEDTQAQSCLWRSTLSPLFGVLWPLPGDLCIVRALFFFLSFYLLLINLINTGHSISFGYTCIWQLCFYHLKGLPYCFPLWLDQFTFPPRVYKGFLFSTFLPTFTFCLFNNSHSNRCEVLAHCDFDLHVPDN